VGEEVEKDKRGKFLMGGEPFWNPVYQMWPFLEHLIPVRRHLKIFLIGRWN